LEIKKEVFDSEVLEDIHKILEALKKSDDKAVQKLMQDAFSND
jgi:DNA-binding GntR family transcriptional regulator